MSRRSRRRNKSLTTDLATRANAITDHSGPKVLEEPPFGEGGPIKPRLPYVPQYINGNAAKADIPYGANISFFPRGEDGRLTAFGMLEAVARSNDVVGACIAYIQNNLTALDWAILPVDPKDSDDPLIMATAKEISEFFNRPNRVGNRDWPQFLHGLIDEVCITDAISIQPVFDKLGRIHSFPQIDGGTIKLLVDEFGYCPRFPEPAFQQVLKGRVEGEFVQATAGSKRDDQLVYKPFWPGKVWDYGRSPVERVMQHILTGIRRWTYALETYNELTLPQVYVETPDGTGPDEAFQWHNLLNDVIAASTGKRFKFLPLPPGANVREVRQPVWTRDQDEWIARVVMFGFGVNPLPLVNLMSRATADVAETIQSDTGLQPLKKMVGALITHLIGIGWGPAVGRRLKFEFVTDKTDVSIQRAQTLDLYQKNGWMKPWEIRENVLGLVPDEEIRKLPAGPLPVAGQAVPTADQNAGQGPYSQGDSMGQFSNPDSGEPAPAIPSGPVASDITFDELTLAMERLKAFGDEVMVNNLRDVMARRLGLPAPAPLSIASEVQDQIAVETKTPDPTQVPKAEVEELSKWRRMVKRAGAKTKRAGEFESEILSKQTIAMVRAGLPLCESDRDIDDLFSLAKSSRAHKREGERGFHVARARITRAVEGILSQQESSMVAKASEELTRRLRAVGGA